MGVGVRLSPDALEFVMDEEMEILAWRLSSDWKDNWGTNADGFHVSYKYASDTEGRWWRREEEKVFLRETKIAYCEVVGPVY